MKPYLLRQDQGRAYSWYGHAFTVKAAGDETYGGLGVMELVTKKGDEPPSHVHEDEDEIFYVLEGALTFRCDGHELHATARDFIFLPRNIEHGYTIKSDGPVRLLILTTPSGFADRVEATGEPRPS